MDLSFRELKVHKYPGCWRVWNESMLRSEFSKREKKKNKQNLREVGMKLLGYR